MRVADYIFERLSNIGVRNVYLVTGRGALFLTDAVAKNKKLNHFPMHHEQSCGYAAAAEAQLTNSMSACLVSTGCASTNALTPVLSAYQDSLPVFFISGQNILHETSRYNKNSIRTYGQQEADIIEIVKPITKYAHMVTCSEEVPRVMDSAISHALSGRKGPVWIDVPLDIQSAVLDILPEECNTKLDVQACTPDVSDIKFIVQQLSYASRPVVLIGSGVHLSDASEKLISFIECNNLPLVYAPSAPDVVPLEHKNSIGSLGSMGCSRAGALAVQNSDFLLVLGHRLNSYVTGPDFCTFARESEIFVVDIDKVEHTKKGVKIDRFIHSDIGYFLDQMPERKLTKSAVSSWLEVARDWKESYKSVDYFKFTETVDLYDLSENLSHVLQKNAILITDSGFAEIIIPSNMNFSHGKRSIHPVSQGAMGFALPAAVGVYASHPERQVVVVVGDGSIMMNLQELQTLKHFSIPVKVIVLNNNGYSIIRRRQKELFRKRTIGTDDSNGVSVPDFSKLAKAFGFKYFSVGSSVDLESGLQKALNAEGSVLCEVLCREDQQYPEVSYGRNSEGRFVRRPLEDQYPFLDRDDIRSQMIIPFLD